MFARHWPTEEEPLAELLNTKPKLVASTRPDIRLSWGPSSATDDPIGQVRAFAASLDGPLVVIGSGNLVTQLISGDQIDELRVMIDPLILGRGKRLFDSYGGQTRRLELTAVTPLTTGAILATYIAPREQKAQGWSRGSW